MDRVAFLAKQREKRDRMAETKLSMKLLIDSRGKRVLFAEAGNECVDFLFHLLSLPVASVIRLLGDNGMGGSLPKLYKSLEALNDTYIDEGKNKDAYLKPAAPVSSGSVLLLPLEDSYRCNYCSSGNGYSGPGECGNCGSQKSKIARNVEGGGLVKGVVTYMVMDDLEVKPMSTISSIALLNTFNVKDVGALEEKVVTLGTEEALRLLKISLESNKVLTDLFC